MKYTIVTILFLLSMLLSACDKDEENIQTTGPNALSQQQKDLLINVVTDGSIDVDWNSLNCAGIVTFTFDQVNQNFTESTNTDLTALFASIEQTTGNTVSYDDIIVLSVSIQTQGTSLVLENQTAIDDYFEDCSYDGSINDIGPTSLLPCLTLTFPVTIFVYDIETESTEEFNFTIEDDLLSFLQQNSNNQVLEINYPITFTDEDENSIVVTSNEQLEDVLNDAIDECGSND